MLLKQKVNYLVPLLIIVLLVSLLSGCDTKPAPENTGDKKDTTAPVFKLAELNSGQEISFPDDFKGKKTALVFFSRE